MDPGLLLIALIAGVVGLGWWRAPEPRDPRAVVRDLWQSLTAIDLRALASFRLGLGLLILVDLALRSGHLWEHYSDWGVLPVASAVEWLGPGARISIHLLSGSAGWQALLLLAAALVATALALGWRTRWMAVLSFYLLLSLHLRNPAILSGADNMLRLLLFWSMFLPLGGRWSVDARAAAPTRSSVHGIAAFALLMQLCCVYWFTVATKWNAEWTRDFTAVEHALWLDYMTTGWGELLLVLGPILPLATALTLLWEMVAPILVWSPIATARLRTVAALGFIIFHVVMLAPALRIGLFPWVAAVAWLLFLPAAFWDRLEGGVSAATGSVEAERPKKSKIRAAVVLVVALLVLVLGLADLDAERYGRWVPEGVVEGARLYGFVQTWPMFSRVMSSTGWYVAPGVLADGSTVDLWSGEALTMARPRPVSQAWGSVHWTKYLAQLFTPEFVHHRRLFGNYLCRRWDELHPQNPARSLQLLRQDQTIEIPGGRAEPRTVLLFAQECPGSGG